MVVAANSAKAATSTIRPKATSYQVAIAKSAGEKARPGAMLWNWWDQGYFLAYYSGLRTIIDGGKQSPDRLFISALPLTVDDPTLAANWMKFFAARGPRALQMIIQRTGKKRKAADFLVRALSEKAPLSELIEEYGLKRDERYWRNYLFPEAEVYLYLNHELFEKAPWWFSFGSGKNYTEHWSSPDAVIFKPGEFSIDAKKGDIAFRDRLMTLSSLYVSKFRPIPRVMAHRIYEGQNGPAALWVRDLDISYMFDGVLEDSLFMKLLLFDPYSPPEGYELVKYVPLQGGLWRVK